MINKFLFLNMERIEINTFDKSETLEIVSNQNEKYNLTISNNSNIIELKIDVINFFSENIFFFQATLEELQKINRFFLIFENINDISETLIKLAKEKNLKLEKNDDILKIKIKNQIIGNEFSIQLKEKEKELKHKIDNIIPLFTEFNKRIENLEKLTKDLADKNEELLKQNKDLKNKNNILEKRIEILEKRVKLFFSNIINKNDEQVILNWIPNEVISAELIFDTYRDGDSIDSFKNRCEGKSPTLVIIKTTQNIIIGGFTTASWKKEGYSSDDNAFVFSLNPNKKYKVLNAGSAVYGYNYNLNIMFQFGGCEFRITNNCTKSNNNEYMGYKHNGYESGLKDLLTGDHKFIVERLEIFNLNF